MSCGGWWDNYPYRYDLRTQPAVCPGCGRCNHCGRPYAAPPMPKPYRLDYPVEPQIQTTPWPGDHVEPNWELELGWPYAPSPTCGGGMDADAVFTTTIGATS